jgi:malate dehydrogenase (oxaloacetate-decarboxylating)
MRLVQGTGSVTLSGLMSAIKIAGGQLKDARVLCAGMSIFMLNALYVQHNMCGLCQGAGSAGLGVCDQIVQGMMESGGLTRQQAMSQFVVCTSKGTLGANDGKHGDPNYKRHLEDYQRDWINRGISDGMSIADAVLEFKPNVLLGLSTKPNVFDETVIRNMAKVNAKPIIMPMSNPTSKCECTPEEAYKWTDGHAIVSPIHLRAKI